MNFSPLLTRLIEGLRCLPGVGPKSAQRMAFHLLERERERGLALAETLHDALIHIQRCERCNNFSEQSLCTLCNNPKRDTQQLCIVESPADVLAIEQSASYRGYYYVLQGHLSPIDGIGPEAIGIPKLNQLLQTQAINEMILATNPTVEGEATAYFISQLAQRAGITVTRIAHGVPVGGELEFVDSTTLTRAIENRSRMYAETV